MLLRLCAIGADACNIALQERLRLDSFFDFYFELAEKNVHMREIGHVYFN